MGHAPSPSPLFLAKQIKPGEIRNPTGRNGGRALALQVLDKMLSTAGNKEKLRKDFQKEFDKSPSRFFLVYIMPLIPKEAKIQLQDGQGGPVQWVSLLTTFPTQPNVKSITPVDIGSAQCVAADAGERPSSEAPSLSIAPQPAQANMAG